MAVKNKWAILFAGIAGILSVWGYWGGGTAAGLLPEKDKNIEVSSASGEASDGFSEGRMDGGSRKVYDAALHRREGPMKDPFHVAGIEAVAAEAASAAGKTHAAPLGNTAPSVKTDSESIKQTPLLPELKGIIYFGEEKRAIAELGGVVKTLKEGEQIGIWTVSSIREKNAGVMMRPFRLSYADAREVAEGMKAVAGDHVTYNKSANTVIVKGTPFELMQAESLIRELDVPEKQVKVEAEVVAVNKTYAKELGIDWDFKSLTGSASYDRTSWTEQHYVTDSSGNVLYDSDGNPRIRNVEHDGWDVSIPEGYAGISYGKSLSGHPYTFFFQAKLNALISEGKAKVLAKPNVVTMNGRKAEILIGSKIPVIVEHLENGVQTTATEYKDAGIKLTYTPLISRKNEITADVNAEVSTPYLVPEMRAYRIITRSANTMVRLKSGDMITIGGLIDKEESRTFRKVPILGDIPILGKLFQSRGKSIDESEIVIMIRAEILE